MNKKIKWGIVGTGTIAHQFAADFEFANFGDLIAVASRNIESARRLICGFFAFIQLIRMPVEADVFPGALMNGCAGRDEIEAKGSEFGQ